MCLHASLFNMVRAVEHLDLTSDGPVVGRGPGGSGQILQRLLTVAERIVCAAAPEQRLCIPLLLCQHLPCRTIKSSATINVWYFSGGPGTNMRKRQPPNLWQYWTAAIGLRPTLEEISKHAHGCSVAQHAAEEMHCCPACSCLDASSLARGHSYRRTCEQFHITPCQSCSLI